MGDGMEEQELMVAPAPGQLQPVADGAEAEGRLERIDGTDGYQARSGRFILKKKKFTQQFSHIYNQRIAALQAPLEQRAQKMWPDVPLCAQLVQMRDGEKRVVVGTTYKTMKLKPSILEEYKTERGLCKAVLVPQGNFSSEDDLLTLEDSSGRLTLTGEIDATAISAGVALAVMGTLNEEGQFEVEAWCDAGLPPAPTIAPRLLKGTNTPSDSTSSGGGSSGQGGAAKLVLLVSGLMCGGPTNPMLSEMLVDYVVGYLGGKEDQAGVAARISRVIICGNSVVPADAIISSRRGPVDAQKQMAAAAPLREFDSFLSLLCASVPVDVMPGALDPANYTLPQQPLHLCTVPTSVQFGTCNRVSNPHEAVVGGRLFLGSSGQPLEDLRKYTRDPLRRKKKESKGSQEEGKEGKDGAMEVDSRGEGSKQGELGEAGGGGEGEVEPWCLRQLESTLTTRHMAPTAPDTLGCYPFEDMDPFVIEECPHVYFAGNQPEFATKEIISSDSEHRCRLVCLPPFATSGTAALLDLDTLACEPLHFGVEGFEE